MKGVLVAAWSLSIILSGCLSSDEPTPEPPAPIKAKLVGYTLECPDLATDDDCTTTIPIPTENHLAGLGIAQNQHDPQHLMLYVKEAANAAFGVGRLVPNRLTGVPPEVWIVSSTDGGQSWHEAHPLLDPWAEPSKPNHPIQYHDLHLPAIFSGANGTWTTILGKTWYGSQEDGGYYSEFKRGILTSQDEGKTWQEIPSNIDATDYWKSRWLQGADGRLWHAYQEDNFNDPLKVGQSTTSNGHDQWQYASYLPTSRDERDVDICNDPSGVAWSPDGTAYVACIAQKEVVENEIRRMESIGVMLFRVTDAGDELIPVTLAQPHACKVFDLVGDQDSLTLIRTGCDNPSWLRWHWGNWDAPEQGDLSNTLAQPIKGFARSVQLDPWGGLHLLVEFTEFMEVADGIPLIGLPMVVQSEYVILDAQTLQLLWQETLYEGELPPGTVQDASYYEHRPRFSFHENQVQAYWATNQGLHIRALAPVLESQPTDG